MTTRDRLMEEIDRVLAENDFSGTLKINIRHSDVCSMSIVPQESAILFKAPKVPRRDE